MHTQPAEVELQRLKYAIKDVDGWLFGVAKSMHKQAMSAEYAEVKDALETHADAYREAALMLRTVTSSVESLGEMNQWQAETAIHEWVLKSFMTVTRVTIPWPE